MRFCPAFSTLLMAAVLATVAHADKPAATSVPAAKAPAPPKGADAGDKVFPAQSTVAAKTVFGTVPTSDKAVIEALDAKALAEATKQVGKQGAFQGIISKVYVPHGNKAVILDFAPDYHEALTATVKPDAYAKFPDLAALQGKHVLIRGKFLLYHNAPQIELTSPDQIKVIL